MTHDTTLKLIAMLGVSALPLAVWGTLAIAAKVWNANLRPVLSWLRASRWVTWIVGVALTAVGTLFNGHSWLWPIGLSIVGFSFGLIFAEGWLNRRYAPDISG